MGILAVVLTRLVWVYINDIIDNPSSGDYNLLMIFVALIICFVVHNGARIALYRINLMPVYFTIQINHSK